MPDIVNTENNTKEYKLSDGRIIKINSEYRICGNVIGNFIKIEKQGLYGFIIIQDKDFTNIDDYPSVEKVKTWVETHNYFPSINNEVSEEYKENFFNEYSKVLNDLKQYGYSVFEPKYTSLDISKENSLTAQNDDEFLLYNALGFGEDFYDCFLPIRTKIKNYKMSSKKPFKDSIDYIVLIPNGFTYILFDLGLKNGGIIEEDIVDTLSYMRYENIALYLKKDNSIVGYTDTGNFVGKYSIVNRINTTKFVIKNTSDNSLYLLDTEKNRLLHVKPIKKDGFNYTDFFNDGIYIFDDEFNVVEKYNKKEKKNLLTRKIQRSYIDKDGKKICSDKNLDKVLSKKIERMNKHPEKYVLKNNVENKDVNSEIYELEDKIFKYLEQYNVDKLNKKFEEMRNNHDNKMSILSAEEISKRKEFINKGINEVSISLSTDHGIKSDFIKYKNELKCFLDQLIDDKYIFDILHKLRNISSLIDTPIDQTKDELINNCNTLINDLYTKLDNDLKTKNICLLKQVINKYTDQINEYLDRKSDNVKYKYSSYEAWENDFRKDLHELIIFFKKDYSVQCVNDRIKICEDSKREIEENSNDILFMYCNEINNIVNTIKKQTNDPEILEKLHKYENYQIDNDKSFNENKEDAINKLQELVKLQVLIDFVLDPKRYDAYEPRNSRKK